MLTLPSPILHPTPFFSVPRALGDATAASGVAWQWQWPLGLMAYAPHPRRAQPPFGGVQEGVVGGQVASSCTHLRVRVDDEVCGMRRNLPLVMTDRQLLLGRGVGDVRLSHPHGPPHTPREREGCCLWNQPNNRSLTFIDVAVISNFCLDSRPELLPGEVWWPPLYLLLRCVHFWGCIPRRARGRLGSTGWWMGAGLRCDWTRGEWG